MPAVGEHGDQIVESDQGSVCRPAIKVKPRQAVVAATKDFIPNFIALPLKHKYCWSTLGIRV